MNFLGLGFSFGAKDSGLEETQNAILANFESMSARMLELGQAADKSAMGEFVSPGQTERLDKLGAGLERATEQVGNWQRQSRNAKGQFQGISESVETTTDALGDFKEQSRNTAGQFQRNASQLETDQRKVGGGFNFIRDSMEKLDSVVRQNKLQTFIQAISLARLNDIAGGLSDIGSQGTNLTTGLEGEMHSLGKAARATGANFGYTGKELKKFTSKAAGMAKGLAIDANTAATSLRAWDEAGSELAAMGFKNAKQVAKFSEAYGVNADVLRNSGLRMRKEFGMQDKEISQVTGAFAKMGQITGDVTGAMGEMPKMMDLLRRRAASMGKSLDSKQLASYAASSAGLAAGFMQMGQSSAQAREHAMSLTEEMIKSKEGFQDMFGGVGADLSDFNKDIAIAFGDVGVSFESMSKGPEEFISGMAEMVQKAKKNGDLTTQQTNIMSAHLRKAFGDDRAAELMLFFDKADQATLDLMKTVKKTPAALGKMADEGFMSSKTLADRFEEAEQRMVMSFRKIGKASSRDFVSDSEKQFKAFGNTLKTMAGKGGLMGAFITKMSEAHQLGVKAFLPKTLRPMAALMGNVVKEMTPVAGALGAMGLRMKHLANPFLLTAAAAGGMFALFKSNEKRILGQNKNYQSQETALGKLKKQLDRRKRSGKEWQSVAEKIKITEASLAAMRVSAAKEAKTQTIAQVEEGVRSAIQKIGMVGSILVVEMKKWLPAVKEFLSTFWHTMIYGVDPNGGASSFASEMGTKLGGAVRMAAELAYTFVVDYLSQWWQGMLTIWSDDSTSFTDKIKATFESSAGIILGAFAVAKFTPIFGILGKLIFTLGVPLVKAVGRAAFAIATTLGKALIRMVGAIMTSVLPALSSMATALFTRVIPAVVRFAWTTMVSAVKAVMSLAMALVTTVLPVLGALAVALFTTVIPAIASFGVAVAVALWPFTLVAAAVAAVVLLGKVIYDNWGSIKEFFADTFGAIIDTLAVIWKPIGKILMAPIDLAKGAWKFISTVFTDPIGAVKEAWAGLVGWFGDLFDDLVDIPKKAWNNVKSFGSDTKDLFSGDLVPALMSKNEQQIATLTTALKQRGQSETQIAEAVRAAQASGNLKGLDIGDNNNPFYMKLRKNNFDVQQAIADDTDFFGMQKWRSAEKLANKLEWEAQRAANAQIGSAKSVTAVVGEEAIKQAGAVVAGVNTVVGGVEAATTTMESDIKGKTEGLLGSLRGRISGGLESLKGLIQTGMDKAKEFAEENAPAKAMIVDAKSMAKIGPAAQQAFGASGKALDGFSTKFTGRFEGDGKKSIAAIADKSFARIEKRAYQFKNVMRDIWSDILAMTVVAINAIQMDAITVASKLNAIAKASATVSKQSDETPVMTKTFKAGESKDEAMLNATHWPDWYTQDFKKIAMAMRDSMQAQSVAGRVGPSASAGARITLKSTKATNSAASRTGNGGPSAGGAPT